MAKRLRCRHCGAVGGNDLHCSTECRENSASVQAQAIAALGKQGFAAHAEHKNAFVKDGVILTIEEYLHHGPKKALLRHANAVQQSRR